MSERPRWKPWAIAAAVIVAAAWVILWGFAGFYIGSHPVTIEVHVIKEPT